MLSGFRKINGDKRKVLMNIVWAMAGKVINMAGTLFVGVLVARYLGPEKYGIMNYVISYVTLFTVISSFGLENIEIRELAKSHESKNVILGTCFGIRLCCSFMAFLILACTLLINHIDRYTSLMIMCYSLTLFTGCFNIIRNYFTSIVKNEYVVKTEISRTVVGACIKIVLLMLRAPLTLFVFASIFDTILVASGYVLAYSKTVGKISDWTFDITQVPFFVKESFPLLLSGAAVIVYNRIDQVMIGNMIDNESVGYFATAVKFLDLALFLPGVLVQTITPLLVKIRRNGSEMEYSIKAQQFVNVVVWCSIILSLLIIFS